MFLRAVWKRWNGRPVDAVVADGGSADACPATSSLLAELAADPEDFADHARVLNVDLPTVVRAIVAAQPPTIAALVAQLETRMGPVAADAAPPETQHHQSRGSGEAVGWGRWTRTRGGVRVHRATTAAARTALAAP